MRVRVNEAGKRLLGSSDKCQAGNALVCCLGTRDLRKSSHENAPALLVLFLAMAVAVVSFAVTASAKPRTAQDPTAIPISAPYSDPATENIVGEFAGTFDVQRFVVEDGELQAVGRLVGSLTNNETGIAMPVNEIVSLPVDVAQSDGSCQILDLILGPLDVDLLGLVIHLDQVHLNITAQSGPGTCSATCCALWQARLMAPPVSMPSSPKSPTSSINCWECLDDRGLVVL